MTIKKLTEDIKEIIEKTHNKLEVAISNDVYETIEKSIDDIDDKLTEQYGNIYDKIDKIEDDIRDLREKLGEILTILYSR